MPILVDTNILLRSVQTTHFMHASAVQALATLIERDETLLVSVQNMAEFWNVATRPEANNGLGFSIEEARDELTKLEGFFVVLHEDGASYDAWKTLVIQNRVQGVEVHDARLVSVMLTCGVRQILTFNTKDFIRYAGIEAIHPDMVQ